MPGLQRPKVSVIIPVYNTAPYLRRCLDSVCGQTLRDIEIICVNDASTDNSLEILNEYAAKDKRIVVLENIKNLGETASRNAAIAAARGEYLGFVDSDDMVDCDFFGKLYAGAAETDGDIIKGETRVISSDGKTAALVTNTEIIKYGKTAFMNCFWSAIYKTEFIKQQKLTFPAGITNGGDAVFLTGAVLKASAVELVDNAYYVYCRRDDSADSNTLDLKKLNSVFAAYQMISSELQTAGESIANAEVEGYCHVFYTRLIMMIDIWPRAETGEGALICAKTAVNLYRACPRRDFLDAMLAKNWPVWHGFFTGGDIGGFADYLLRHKSKKELIGDNLRFRLLAKKDNQ